MAWFLVVLRGSMVLFTVSRLPWRLSTMSSSFLSWIGASASRSQCMYSCDEGGPYRHRGITEQLFALSIVPWVQILECCSVQGLCRLVVLVCLYGASIWRSSFQDHPAFQCQWRSSACLSSKCSEISGKNSAIASLDGKDTCTAICLWAYGVSTITTLSLHCLRVLNPHVCRGCIQADRPTGVHMHAWQWYQTSARQVVHQIEC